MIDVYVEVVDASARSLRMIYQSKLAPKYDFFHHKDLEFLVSLLNSGSENVTGLGASIITHSCETSAEQKALCEAGVLKRLLALLQASPSQRNACLQSLAALFNNNPQVISDFLGPPETTPFKNNSAALISIEPQTATGTGNPLACIIELTKDRCPRTRLLASNCLIVIRNTSPTYLQDIGIKAKLVQLLLELVDDTGQVGEDASFVFSSLIAKKEDLQRLAFEANAINKFCSHLQKPQLSPKRSQGILLALADLCSKLETCRSTFLSLKVVWCFIQFVNFHASLFFILYCCFIYLFI